MDPQATLARIAQAVRDDDLREQIEAVGDLRAWLRAGGFAPDFTGLDRATLDVLSQEDLGHGCNAEVERLRTQYV